MLLALGVDQWWELQQDRAREQAYYVSLLEDLERDTAEYRSSFEVHQGSTDVANQVLDAVLGVSSFPPVAALLRRATFLNFPQRSTATVDELMSSGTVRLLRDTPIKTAMLAYYRDVDEWKPRLQGSQAMEAILDYRQITQDLVFRLTPRSGVVGLSADALAEELRDRGELAPVIGRMLRTEQLRLNTYQRQLDRALLLIELLHVRLR